jgi:hypothetical protein
MFSKDTKKDDASDVTGSIAPILRSHDDTNLTDADLALARNAASDVLTRGRRTSASLGKIPKPGAGLGNAAGLDLYIRGADLPGFPRELCARHQ